MTADAVETVRVALQSLEREDWPALADLISPVSLKEIQDMQIKMLVAMQQIPPDVPEPPRGGGSLVAVAIPSSEDEVGYGGTRIRLMPGAPTVNALRALS